MGVTGMKRPIGFRLPVVVVVVIVGMVRGRRRRIIWTERIGWRLVVKRIVLLIVSHGFKGEDWLCSTEEGRWWFEGNRQRV